MEITDKKKTKYTKKGLIKLGINALFFATLLSFIVVFVGEYLTSLYGNSVMHGIGVISLAIAWLAWMPSTLKENKMNASFFVTIAFAILAPILLPSPLTFALAGIMAIITIVFTIIIEK